MDTLELTCRNATNRDYRVYQRLLYDLVHRHLKAHGGDPEEAFAEADYLFVLAWDTWEPERAPCFSTWLHFKVKFGLQDLHRANAKRLSRYKQEGEDFLLEDAPEKRQCRLGQLLTELSADALTIARLLLLTPLKNIEEVTRPRAVSRLKWVMEYLLECGWAGERIRESFQEITVALNGEE